MKGARVQHIAFLAMGTFLLVSVSACTSTSQMTPEPHRSVLIIKTTAGDCVSRGGIYDAHENALFGDCVLPPEVKAPQLPGISVETGLAEQVILTSVYDYFYGAGTEKPGYGLYSYVLFPAHSPRAERFLGDLFKTTSYVLHNLIDVRSLNIIYLPTRVDKVSSLIFQIRDGSAPPVDQFVIEFYNYALAQKLLAQICDAPAEVIRDLCETDLSSGPYLFTYARPASSLSPVPPPYLVLDLSQVHLRAFREFIAAYKAQVKRRDYSDHERLNTLRLRVLNIILTAADWINPTKNVVADILHMAKGEGGPRN